MSRRILVIALGSLIILAGPGAARRVAEAAPSVAVNLAANPVNFNGQCPVQVTFSVNFKVTGPCTLKYHFINDKHQKSDAGTLNCPSAGSFKAVKTITLTQSFTGWVAVQVTSPVAVESNQVALQIKCTSGAPPPQANITKVSWVVCTVHSSQLNFSLQGAHFGASQGTKQVRIGTLTGWEALMWTDSTIEVRGPTNIVPWTQTYPVSIVDGGETVSNTVQTRFPFRLELEGVAGNPVQVPAGSTLNISIYGLPAAQGGLTVKLWNAGTAYPIEVLSWQSPTIQVRVPNMPGVGGNLDIFDGGSIASDKHVGLTII